MWIGYNNANAVVLEDEFGDLETIGSATRSEIADVLTTYAQRSSSDGRIVSGLVRAKRMQALAHWVRDFRRIGAEVFIQGLDEESFLQALKISSERAAAWDENSSQQMRVPTSEKEWEKWEPRLIQPTFHPPQSPRDSSCVR